MEEFEPIKKNKIELFSFQKRYQWGVDKKNIEKLSAYIKKYSSKNKDTEIKIEIIIND